MRPVTDLTKMRVAFNGRLRRIRRVIASTLTGPADDHARALAFAVVELDNLVMSAMREFIISSLRGARTATGARVTVTGNFGSADAVGAYVLSIVQAVSFQRLGSPHSVNRRQEAKIRDPRQVEQVLVACNASNVTSVRNALSLNTSLFSDVATVRNFYAHRNGDTWEKVRRQARNRGILTIKHPDELMSYHLPGRPVSLIEDWLDDAELFFDVITE
ncbi:hypothetical protein [Mesorhizobium sp.]|uniref:hypothetical protein n=1 Tax=Mesorhizobium sp. TaxID=1871066 RepID=UPI000FE97268|nr:hypothetical protein [Mesorhizobium sp.]RWA99916.1 MAG: hypothetical protein EOQ33_21845 [Mesorhizobium sp.]